MTSKNSMNPWHDVPIGDKSPKVINSIIEIPKDSTIKYEVDKDTGMLKLDRFLYSAVHYPGDYGFVPQTLWHDEDPLDIIILTQRPVYPLTLAEVRVIGVIRMFDGTEKDDKLIAVYDGDPRYGEFEDIEDIPRHVMEELKHFFSTYKELQGKKVHVLEILSKEHALKDVEVARKMYEERFTLKNAAQ